jgi:hypothetical protein
MEDKGVSIGIGKPSIGQVEIDVGQLNYEKRKLDFCGVCKLKYNVGDRLPRILVNCGHTYCTLCLTKYYRKNRIRCPFCKKLVKKLESVEQLPLNINIFGESVQNNEKILSLIDPESKNYYTATCNFHTEKQKHFFCSYHEINFCRECIKSFHRDDKCCVVDLFDINKLYNLNEQNQYKNYLIVKARNKNSKRSRMKEEFFIANS